MFCTKCGARMSDDARFCSACGSLEGEPAQQPQAQQAAPQPAAQPAAAAVGAAAKAAKGGALLKWVIALAVLAAAAVFVINHFGLVSLFKSDETLIRERIQAFEEAYNQADWDGIMECLDGPTQAMMELTVGFADGLMSELGGIDMGLEDMFSLGGLFMTGDNFQIDIVRIDIQGEYATVGLIIHMNMYDMSQSEEMELPMVKVDNDWYIGGVDLFGSDFLP